MSLMVEPGAAVSELTTGGGCCVLRGGFCEAVGKLGVVTVGVCVGAVSECCVAIIDGAGSVPGFFPCTSMMSRQGFGNRNAEYSLTSLTSSTTRVTSLENCATRMRL